MNMKRFEMQVKMDGEWESVKPSRNSAYTYTTEQEAAEMLDKYYPDQIYGIDVRVKEVII
jgi:hypothetical protein